MRLVPRSTEAALSLPCEVQARSRGAELTPRIHGEPSVALWDGRKRGDP